VKLPVAISQTGSQAAAEQRGWLRAGLRSRVARKARGAQGIEVEILFYREAVKKIEAESPVFARVCGQKCAQILIIEAKL
jgi:hypothetical protein